MNAKVRTILTAVAAVLGAVVVALPTLGAPVWIAAVIGVVLVACAAVGIVPPQVGGQQAGVVNPSITGHEPDVNEVPAGVPVE